MLQHGHPRKYDVHCRDQQFHGLHLYVLRRPMARPRRRVVLHRPRRSRFCHHHAGRANDDLGEKISRVDEGAIFQIRADSGFHLASEGV